MTTEETGTVTGTRPATATPNWPGLFRKAQADSRKGTEMGKQLLRSRLAS